ncbi:MAG TPA: ricin-type beta-trefoil lectin domain protein [Trebonia sp.]|nr:ricin-type beta-trefoil lectin domain protein [Trebonia sp.]
MKRTAILATVLAAGAAGSGTLAMPRPALADAGGPAELVYRPITSVSGLCLDDLDDSYLDGTQVQLWRCNGGHAQQWRETLTGHIVNRNGLCLDGQDAAAGGTLEVWRCNADPAQIWQLNPGAQEIDSKEAGLALTAEALARQAPLTLSVPDSSAAQQWTSMPLAGGAGHPALGPVRIAGTNITMSGQILTPYGFALSSTQYPDGANGTGGPPYLDGSGEFPTMVSQVEAQIDAIAGAWHGNTVRFQIAQDTLLGPDGASYLADIEQIVSYAQEVGLVVVLNDNTEPAGTAIADEALPTQATIAFWRDLAPYYAGDRSVIVDPFNEPRDVREPSDEAAWQLWKNGGDYGYDGSGHRLPAPIDGIGFQSLITELRGMGYRNQFWIETPALTVQGLGMLIRDWPGYQLSDPEHNVVYEYHHTTVDGSARTIANWDAQFGKLVQRSHSPVVDGEWTQRQQDGNWHAPNGDTGGCWSDAPTAVPRYLRYLQVEGIGLLAWTLGTTNSGAFGILNADHGDLTSTNSYGDAATYGCTLNGPTQGAGQDLMTWFDQQDG